jgi:hypothetical protein
MLKWEVASGWHTLAARSKRKGTAAFLKSKESYAHPPFGLQGQCVSRFSCETSEHQSVRVFVQLFKADLNATCMDSFLSFGICLQIRAPTMYRDLDEGLRFVALPQCATAGWVS